MLLVLLGLAAAGYAVAALWLMSQETRLVFQAVKILGDGRPPFPYEQVDLPRTDGERQFAWVMRHRRPADGPWVLYLHGNPSTIASPVNVSHYQLLRDLGLNVVAPEYRGFGGLAGTPTEAGLLSDAAAAYDYLRRAHGIAPGRIVLYGWSLGGAVAVDLALHAQPAAVILEAAPASIADINQKRYPLFPVRLLMRNRFETIQRIDGVSSPILFLHSPEDQVVPIADARRLYAAARGEKTFVEVRGGHVDAIAVDTERFARVIRRFLTGHGVLEPAPATRGDRGQ